MHIKHRLALLVAAFVLAFAVFGAVAFDTLNALKVNGPYYHQIVQGKDLVADILPPPEYVTTFGDPSLQDGKSEYSRLALAISIERDKRTSFWKLTAGVYAAFILSLLAFFYDSDQTSLMSARSSILVGSLFAAIINMRASEGILGHTENLTLVDKIHILTIFYVFAGALATIISRLLSEKKQGKKAMRLDRLVFFPSFLISYVAINVVLVWMAPFTG